MLKLLSLLLLVVGCSVPQNRKLDIALRNETDKPMILNMKAGILSKKLILKPGQSWNGWIWKDLPISSVEVDIQESNDE